MFEQDFLAFTREEAMAYFRLHHCPEAAAEQAWRFSEGWAAALWLCLQSWRKNGVVTPVRDVETLLRETVFSAYDTGERNLLLQLSVLNRFTSGEAISLTGDPDARNGLRELRDKNALLGYDPATDSYHLHSLFRAFLQKALDGTPDIDKPALYRRAGECHAARGDLMPAVRFFVRAGREEDLLRILETFMLPGGNLLVFFFTDEIMSMVQSIPWPLRDQRPIEYLAFIYFCLAELGDLRAAALLEEAEEHFAGAEDISAATRKRIKGEVALIKSMLAFNDLWAMRDIYAESHRLLNGRSAISSRRMVWTFGCPCMAFLYLREPGTYRNMVEVVEEGLHFFQDLSGGCTVGGEQLFRAEWLLERGKLDGVEEMLATACRRAEAKKQTSTLLAAAFASARLQAARGRVADAVAVLEGGRLKVQAMGHVDFANCLDLSLGYVNATLGRREGIPEWLRQGDFGPSRNVVQILGFMHVVHGKAVLLAGGAERLDTVAKSIPAHLGPYDNLFGHIHAKALEAIAAHRLGDTDRALALLREAAALARPDGIVLTLAEYGAALLPVAERLRDEVRGDKFFATLAQQTERYMRLTAGTAVRDIAGSRLTAREEEIMRLVARGKSNASIAKQLGVMESTVKKALTLIFPKLKARNRTEAARKFLRRG